MSYNNQLEKEIREAYIFLREKNQSIPSETLDFMLQASLDKINPNNPKILLELKSISDVYFNKKDYISSGQINRAMDVIEDYFGEINYSKKDESKDNINYRIELEE